MNSNTIFPRQYFEINVPQSNNQNNAPETNSSQTVPESNAPAPETNVPSANSDQSQSQPETKSMGVLVLPISDALDRVTKKSFGLKVSPQDSPVSPERFSGYHTGVNFETFSGEENIDVPVYAVCPGSIILKRTAAGYGGVMVESCTLEGNAITVIYGHLKLSSMEKKLGDSFLSGEKIGVLGKGYSTETDEERKHLHLGIHKGSMVTLLGYVRKESELSNWIDAMEYLK